MDPGSLKQEELNYELRIRGLSSSGTVDLKRRLLRGALSQESANRSFQEHVSHPYKIEEDVAEIQVTLDELKKLIEEFNGNRTDSVYRRITSRLIHVSRRIAKVPTTDHDEDEQKKSLNTALLMLEGDLEDKLISSIPPLHASTPTNVVAPANVGLAATGSLTTVVPRNSVAPYKWNIFFSGSNNESVNSFLEKIDCLRESRGVSKDELFCAAGDLFKGPAWTWFLNNRHRVKNWDELVDKLKTDFLPYFYQEDLEREISTRTQGSNERVCLFITAMEGLFNRLNIKPDEATMVNRICRNLLPFYVSHLALHSPTTIAELTTLCRKLEESKLWSERYKPPPHSRSGLIEPDLACSTSKGSQNSYFANKNCFRSKNSQEVSVINTLKCWNCDVVGHRYSDCSRPRTKFCYGCGIKNIIRPQCQVCKGKSLKNGLSGVKELDVGTSVAALSPVPKVKEKPTTSQNKKYSDKSKK